MNTGFKAYYNWDLTVDIGATGFTLVVMEVPGANLGYGGGGPFLGFTLSGLNFTPGATITGVTQTSAVCAVPDSLGCISGPRSPNITFTGDSVTVEAYALGGNQTFTYEFTTEESAPTPVPEPTSLVLLGTGIATCVASRRRRK